MSDPLPRAFSAPRPSSCPICCVQEACISTAVSFSTEHVVMRRIMGIELAGFGSRPDNLIYHDIAQAYNTEVRAPMLRAGLQCVAWTRLQVQHHFEHHIDLVPRRVVARLLRRFEEMSAMVDAEVATAKEKSTDEDTEILDARTIKKQIDLAKATTTLMKEYRIFQREDQSSCGIDNILRSVQLGQTTAQDAQRMLEIAAMAKCVHGGVEMPRASELFE
jgi:hypothetical protein